MDESFFNNLKSMTGDYPNLLKVKEEIESDNIYGNLFFNNETYIKDNNNEDYDGINNIEKIAKNEYLDNMNYSNYFKKQDIFNDNDNNSVNSDLNRIKDKNSIYDSILKIVKEENINNTKNENKEIDTEMKYDLLGNSLLNNVSTSFSIGNLNNSKNNIIFPENFFYMIKHNDSMDNCPKSDFSLSFFTENLNKELTNLSSTFQEIKSNNKKYLEEISSLNSDLILVDELLSLMKLEINMTKNSEECMNVNEILNSYENIISLLNFNSLFENQKERCDSVNTKSECDDDTTSLNSYVNMNRNVKDECEDENALLVKTCMKSIKARNKMIDIHSSINDSTSLFFNDLLGNFCYLKQLLSSQTQFGNSINPIPIDKKPLIKTYFSKPLTRRISKRENSKKYTIKDFTTKKSIVQLALNTNIIHASKVSGVTVKNIKRWIANGPERKKGCGRKNVDIELENMLKKHLLEYKDRIYSKLTLNELNSHQTHNIKVSYKWIRKQCEKILEENPNFRCKNFICSNTWIRKFFKKHNMNLKMFNVIDNNHN